MTILKKIFQEPTEVIFEGTEEDCQIILQTLSSYHKYDSYIEICIKEEQTPEFKTLKEFFKIYEYQYTYEELLKKKEKNEK